jgi:thioredoxin reductase (NADPH)
MTPHPDEEHAWDAVIVGAGPAGLTAATYLARFRRRVLVLDGGPSRAEWIPESHNTPGFPRGIGGPELVDRMQRQAVEFGATVRPGLAEALETVPGGFRLTGPFGRARAATILLATGVADRLPPIPGLADAIREGRVRMCPICDGFEAIDRRIAVLAEGAFGEREAEFLRTYSSEVEVLLLGDAGGVAGRRIALADLSVEGPSVRLRGPSPREFDYLYLALGCAARSGLAVAAGARQDEHGKLIADGHQMTTVDGLYAAGDVVRGLNQISVGVGEAAIAATAIHNRLRGAA